MYNLSVADIHGHMVDIALAAVEDQIARLPVAVADAASLSLLCSGAVA